MQRKAGGVRLGESVQRKRGDRLNDLLLRLLRDAVALHARTQLDFNVAHPLFAALEAEGATQLFRFAAAESGGNHGHAQQLLLKERHAQRALQHRFERRMRIDHRLPSLPPHEIRIHHLPDDRPWANDRDLYHNVVEVRGMQAGQARHLRAALDLEHADGVGLLQRAIHGGIVRRQVAPDRPLLCSRCG